MPCPRDHARRLGHAAEARPVQRMGHRADELPRRVAGQLRVGVERDDVAHAPQHRRVADDQREAIAGSRALVAAQQGVQVRELAALALVAHPHPLARVPAPRAVEQKEAIGARRVHRRGGVFSVQRLDLLARVAQQGLVAGQRLLRGIVKVGEQAEAQLRVAVGHEAHFQRFDQLVDAPLAAEHRGHHHQRSRRRAECRTKSPCAATRAACSSTLAAQFTSAIASWLVASNSTQRGHQQPGVGRQRPQGAAPALRRKPGDAAAERQGEADDRAAVVQQRPSGRGATARAGRTAGAPARRVPVRRALHRSGSGPHGRGAGCLRRAAPPPRAASSIAARATSGSDSGLWRAIASTAWR